MENVRTVEDFRIEAHRLGREAFLRRYQAPFMVLVSRIDDDEWEFHTCAAHQVDPRDLPDIVAGNRLDPNAPVLEVVKREGANPFGGFVTIGRTANCDIVLSTARVSKFHCYVLRRDGPDGKVAHSIADADSRNGTRVNDRPLEPRKPADLADGDCIDIGGAATFRFYSPAGFWEALS